MKKSITFIPLVAIGLFLSSCSGISHVIDDDVYVSKTPIISSTEELNDESSFENYRFARDNRMQNNRFGRNSGFSSGFYLQNSMAFRTYCDFNTPFYDPNNSYAYMYYYYWRSGNYTYVTNATLYQCGGNFDNFGGLGHATGNFALINYSNNYFPSGTNFGVGNNVSNINYQQGPRNSIAGVNSINRSGVSGMKGIAVKPTSNRDYKALSSNKSLTTSTNAISSSTSPGGKSGYTSRGVERGTGLATSSRTVSSNSTKRPYNSSSGVTTRSSSSSVGSSGSSRSSGSSNVNSGTTRTNTGSGTTRPGSGSGSTQGRRGGN